MQPQNNILYFADPMCSWCWGFSPVIKSVQKQFNQQLPLHIFLGGLSTGKQDALDESAKKSIRSHWEHVHEQTGQPFNFEFFKREGFVYNTELACRAVVTARRLNSEQALDFLIHLHRQFYQELKDTTDPLVLFEIAGEFGFNKSDYAAEFHSEQTEAETKSDFKATKQFGVNGFPSLYVGNMNEGYTVLTQGYQAYENIEKIMVSCLEQEK